MGNGGLLPEKSCWCQDSGDFPERGKTVSIESAKKSSLKIIGFLIEKQSTCVAVAWHCHWPLHCCRCCHCHFVLGTSFCHSMQLRCGSCHGIWLLLVILQVFSSMLWSLAHFSSMLRHLAVFFLHGMVFCYGFPHAVAFSNIFLHATVFGGHCTSCRSIWRGCTLCCSNWSNQPTSTTAGNSGICFQKKSHWCQDSGDFPERGKPVTIEVQKNWLNIIFLRKTNKQPVWQWLGIIVGIAIALLSMLSCLFVKGIIQWHSSCCCHMQLQCVSCCFIWLCCSSSCSIILHAAEFGNIFLLCCSIWQHFSFVPRHFATVFLMSQHLAMFFFVLQCLEGIVHCATAFRGIAHCATLFRGIVHHATVTGATS